MKLNELLEIIEGDLEFVLFKGDRVGVFERDDEGLKSYSNCEINEITVENNRLTISLD